MLRRARRDGGRKSLLSPRRRRPWEMAVLRVRTRYECATTDLPSQKRGRLQIRVCVRFACAEAFSKPRTPHPVITPFNCNVSVLCTTTRMRALPKTGVGHTLTSHPRRQGGKAAAQKLDGRARHRARARAGTMLELARCALRV